MIFLLATAIAACNEREPAPVVAPPTEQFATAAPSNSMQAAADQLAAAAVMPEKKQLETNAASELAAGAPVADASAHVAGACDDALVWLAPGDDPTLMPLFGDGELQRVAVRPAGISINGKVQIVPLPDDAMRWEMLEAGESGVPRAAGVELGGQQVVLAVAYQTKQLSQRLALVRWQAGKPSVLATVGSATAQLPEGLAVADANGAVVIYQLGKAGLVATKSAKTLQALCAAAAKSTVIAP